MLRIQKVIRNEDGNILIGVVLISMLIGMLSALTLTTGQQADWASAKDRNHEIALGVTEAGVHDALTRVESTVANAYVNGIPTFGGETEQGSYTATVTRVGDNFVVDAEGTVAAANRLQRKRHVKVTLAPPELFPGAGYALFSKQALYLKNNNEVYNGDVWANDSVWVEANAIIEGSLTSATSWIRLEQHANVSGFVWSGGRNCTAQTGTPPLCTAGWGINQTSGRIGGFAKSSVSAPNCAAENPSAYSVIIGGQVAGDLTAFGIKQGSGTVSGVTNTGLCTAAQPRKDPPVFTFNRWNYRQDTYREFGMNTGNGAQEFNTALNSNTGMTKSALEGTFVIRECGGGVVNINGVELAGDVTIVTNPFPTPGCMGARIWTDNVGDNALAAGEKARFVLVSHYEQPQDQPCTDKDSEFCAIAAKNHFDPDCKVSTLVYADNGPVAMKNDTGNSDMCGSVIANGIHMKNGLQLTYDPVFDRVLGFGPNVYEIARWEELPVS